MNRGRKHDNAIKKAEIAQRRKVVAANLLAGATYAEIAGALGVSKATVASDYKALLAEWRALYAEKADEYVQLVMRRYDVLLNAIWNDAKSGNDLPRLDRALAIIDRQAALVQNKKGGLVGRGVVLFEITEGQPDLLALPEGELEN